jgi:hypothetical protein
MEIIVACGFGMFLGCCWDHYSKRQIEKMHADWKRRSQPQYRA